MKRERKREREEIHCVNTYPIQEGLTTLHILEQDPSTSFLLCPLPKEKITEIATTALARTRKENKATGRISQFNDHRKCRRKAKEIGINGTEEKAAKLYLITEILQEILK